MRLYSSRFSRRDFTQHQHFAILVLRQFLRTDYRGIVQVLAVAAIMLAYFLFKNDPATLQMWLIVAVFLQTFTISLLIMSRQN